MAKPTKFTDKLAAAICARVAAGESVRQIAKDPAMPGARTIWDWLADPRREDFRQAYAAAGLHRGEVLAEEAAEVSGGTLRRAKSGGIDKSEVAAARLHVDTLFRRAGQLNPKKYGPLVRHTGEDGGPIPLVIKRTREGA